MKSRLFWICGCLIIASFSLKSQEEMSLNGTWEIVFDEQLVGKDRGWHQSETFSKLEQKQNVQVPSAWELIKQDYEGVAYYKKSFEVSPDWKDKVIRLHLGAVNYRSEFWLNNEVVGYHEGGFTPFEFRIDEMIKIGATNVLIVRVLGPITMTDQRIDGIGKMETAQWRGGLTAGIWQDVTLSATSEVYIEDVFTQPNIKESQVEISVQLNHTGIHSKEVELLFTVLDSSEEDRREIQMLKRWTLNPGKNVRSCTIPLPEVILWSPDHPHLYDCQVQVSFNSQISDRWSHRFGMRSLTIADKDFYLNGQRMYIKAAFFEGLYPNGIAYPDSEAMARREIQLAKDAGFNTIRPWRRPPVPMWLDLADEMGIMVVGSPTLECMTLPLSTPYLPKRVEHEVRQSILRDRNRACVIQWELFNELHRPVLNQLMRPMAMLARELDPTRLILDESGGWAFGANMYLPKEFEPTKFNDIHNYPGPFINDFHYEGYLSIGMTQKEIEEKGYRGSKVGKNVVAGLMSYVSELGYGSLPNLTSNNRLFKESGNPLTPAYRYHHRLENQQKRVLKESGFSMMYPDMEQFYLDQQQIHGTANKRMLEAVRANPEVDGYCIHALAGGDWVLGAGLIDLWRQPKSYAYEGTKASNQPRIVSIRMHPRNVYADQGTKIEILGINDLEEVAAKVQVEVLDDQSKSVFEVSKTYSWPHGVTYLSDIELSTKGWRGGYTTRVTVTDHQDYVLTQNEYPFNVFGSKDLRLKKGQVAIVGQQDWVGPFLSAYEVQVTKFETHLDRSVPVVVQTDDIELSHLELLFDFANDGGTIIFAAGLPSQSTQDDSSFPLTAQVHPSRGLWTCIPHLVHEHPIFAGLPSNAPMRDIYENVWATNTLRNMKLHGQPIGNPVVASIGFDWFSREHKLQYTGPGDSWWGSDLIAVPFGKGQIIISQLRILEQITIDPVADKLLINLLTFAKFNQR